ncbi:PTS lactose/cellobiose transporter subunit IIA [Caldibacillus debilis]|uniref:PTS lactose/cellobiose transporter subunit IIA n=1 Tax=Caldibacillus debilis TaxID=301148 RepID=UPI0003723E2F|nr:PTS lactose/cellobiose transporter subunit IIA [Caldibacillus debilis]
MKNIDVIMDIIVHAGNARSKAMNAIKLAAEQQIDSAKKLIEEAGKDLVNAHQVQTHLIQEETRGNKTEVSLFMVHAQDHLMNAITIKDLASEIIRLHEIIQEQLLK